MEKAAFVAMLAFALVVVPTALGVRKGAVGFSALVGQGVRPAKVGSTTNLTFAWSAVGRWSWSSC